MPEENEQKKTNKPMQYFDSYANQSRVLLVNPSLKIGLFVAYMGLSLWSTSIGLSSALIIAMTLVNCYLARIGLGKLLKLMLIPASFVLLGSITVMFEVDASTQWLQLNGLGHSIGICSDGLNRGLALFARSFSTISVLYALILNTPMSDIILVLHRLKIPDVILETMTFIYRYIFIFADTSQQIYASQKSRLGYQNFGTSLHSTGQLAGRVFALGMVRAERMHRSMEARCYDGKLNIMAGQYKQMPLFMLLSTALWMLFAGAIYHFNNSLQ